KRIPLTVTEQKYVLVKIYNAVAGSGVSAPAVNAKYAAAVDNAIQQLKAAGSKGVVVSGLDDVNAQLLVLAINNAIQSAAFNPAGAILTRKGDAKAVAQLVNDMKAGSVHTLIMSGVNPVYTL